MSEQENIRLVKLGYEAYGQRDIVALLGWLADDIDWHVPGPSELPFAGSYQGRHEVARFLKMVDETLEFYEFEPREFIAQGNSVAVVGHTKARVKSTGRIYEDDWVHVFTVHKDKLLKFREYYDTAIVVKAFRGD